MICHRCHGEWKEAIRHARRFMVCSKCGYEDVRAVTSDGIPFGPNSPLLYDLNSAPATLWQHLQAWWQQKQEQPHD